MATKKKVPVGPMVRLAGAIQEGSGYRVVVLEVPMAEVEARKAADHGGDLRIIAEDRVLAEVWKRHG